MSVFSLVWFGADAYKNKKLGQREFAKTRVL